MTEEQRRVKRERRRASSARDTAKVMERQAAFRAEHPEEARQRQEELERTRAAWYTAHAATDASEAALYKREWRRKRREAECGTT